MPDPKPDEQLMKSLIGKLYTIVTAGAEGKPTLHKEQLAFEYVHPSTRSYK